MIHPQTLVVDWVVDQMSGKKNIKTVTLPETNIAPKNGWLEYYFPFGKAYFQGIC